MNACCLFHKICLKFCFVESFRSFLCFIFDCKWIWLLIEIEKLFIKFYCDLNMFGNVANLVMIYLLRFRWANTFGWMVFWYIVRNGRRGANKISRLLDLFYVRTGYLKVKTIFYSSPESGSKFKLELLGNYVKKLIRDFKHETY